MFYLNKDRELTVDILQKMINSFVMTVQPRLTKYKNYYDGVQAILNKSYTDPSKPCSRTVMNYCKNIVDSYSGYMATPSCITYSSVDDISDILDILKYNDYQTEDSDFLTDALIYGTASELMYIDEDGKTRFNLIDPTTCFGVYDNSLTGDLIYFVRMYKASEWDNSDLYNLDVYSDTSIKHYLMTGMDGQITFKSEEPHYFSQCPANIFTLKDEKNIFECIIGLQDSVNELLSDEIDDYSAFCDAYLTLVGVDADNEDISSMKENRVLILPEGATASWLTKNSNDAQVENILKRIHESIYRIAQCPDFSSESFVGGVSSGIAIKYRLTGMETKCGSIEGRMKKALQRRIEIICGIASLKLGEDVYRDININFQRNIPNNITDIVAVVNGLKGIVSDKTLLSQVPFVSDVDEEIDNLKTQKEEEAEIYSFEHEEEVEE